MTRPASAAVQSLSVGERPTKGAHGWNIAGVPSHPSRQYCVRFAGRVEPRAGRRHLTRCWVLRVRAATSTSLCHLAGAGARSVSPSDRPAPVAAPHRWGRSRLPHGRARHGTRQTPTARRPYLENCTVDASIQTNLCGQVTKSAWWMPWHQEPMKDVVACEKPRGAGKRAVIRGCPNGETRLESCPVTLA